MTTTTQLAITHLTEGQASAEVTVNGAVNMLDAMSHAGVKSRTTTAEPGSPTEGDRYLLPQSSTGTNWAGNDGAVAVYLNGWIFKTPKEGWRLWVDDEDCVILYDGSSWLWQPVYTLEGGITASTTQAQGQQPLTKMVNIVSTVAVANDVVTLPAAEIGRQCWIYNAGANNLQIFPASGDSLEGAAADASATLGAAKAVLVIAEDATTWWPIPGNAI